MNKTFMCFLALLISACNPKEKDSKIVDGLQTKIERHLTVTIKAIVRNDDKFQLYFSEEITSQYYPEDIVEVNIKGSDMIQDIKFELPQSIYPVKLRLDIGVNKMETPVEIEEIIFTNGQNKTIFKNSSLFEYFKPNKYIDLTENNFVCNRRIVDGVYDPYLISININDIVTNIFSKDAHR